METTVTIWIPNMSGIQMVDLCPGVKWSGIQMVVWKLDWKSLFMVQNVRYLNGPPSYVTWPFEYQTPIMSGIEVFGVQMVTVLQSVSLGIWLINPHSSRLVTHFTALSTMASFEGIATYYSGGWNLNGRGLFCFSMVFCFLMVDKWAPFCSVFQWSRPLESRTFG